MPQYSRYFFPIIVPLIVLLMPLSVFPFDGMTIIQQRVAAIFLFAALSWICRAYPNLCDFCRHYQF